MLMIPNQLEGARIGDYSKLECHSEANPPSINYWTNERGDMIVSGTYITILNYYMSTCFITIISQMHNIENLS